VEKVLRVFRGFAEAEAADADEERNMTPEQRIAIVLEMRERMYGNEPQQGLARVYRIVQREQS